MPNEEPINLPSGAKFAKTVGENPNYYLIINDGNGYFSSRISSITRADIIELYHHVMREPEEVSIEIHPDTWETCTCAGCEIFRSENLNDKLIVEHIQQHEWVDFLSWASKCIHCNVVRIIPHLGEVTYLIKAIDESTTEAPICIHRPINAPASYKADRKS